MSALREALVAIAGLHRDSGERTTHWCHHFGGSEEADHGPGPNSCEECGSTTAHPCQTRQLADAALASASATERGLVEELAARRDATKDSLQRMRLNICLNVLMEALGLDDHPTDAPWVRR